MFKYFICQLKVKIIKISYLCLYLWRINIIECSVKQCRIRKQSIWMIFDLDKKINQFHEC